MDKRFRVIIDDLLYDEAIRISKQINKDPKLLDLTNAWVFVEENEDSKPSGT